jgi:hypothetical protein
MTDEQPRRRIVEVARAEQARRADDPNIVTVGYGLKEVGGRVTYTAALKYHVRRKIERPEDIAAEGSTPVPSQVEGIPTDVVVAVVDRPDEAPTGDRGSRKDNPLLGGASTTVLSDWHSIPTGYGTLGGICFDNATDKAMAISNAHVWGTEAGQDVIQPWIPTSEYLEAVVKLLSCGAFISFLVDTTLPSPLTLGLAAAAAGAWVAAALSDAEDPVRWGQGETPPQAGALTDSEVIGVNAEIPPQPWPGMPYSTRAEWRYHRETTGGSLDATITEDRPNEHLLLAKRVWTERATYVDGERVRVCAQIVTDRANRAEDYFVVAHAFPLDGSDRVVHRILTPGRCGRPSGPGDETCFEGFPPPARPGEEARVPVALGSARFVAPQQGLLFRGPVALPDGSLVTSLRFPPEGTVIEFPHPDAVTIDVLHWHSAVTATARDDTGAVLDVAHGTDQQGLLQRLSLTGPRIASVELSGGGNEAEVIRICVLESDIDTTESRIPPEAQRFTYTGSFDLRLHEDPNRWGVSAWVQTVNNIPPGTDPIVAARTVGGLTASHDMQTLADCLTVMLLDHVFDVL